MIFVGNGVVDYREFLMALTAFHDSGENSLKMCFDIFDADGSGEISLQELKHVMGSLMSEAKLETFTMPVSNRQSEGGIGPPMKVTVDDDNLEALFHAIDTNGDGLLSFEEFREWLGGDLQTLHALFVDPMTHALAGERVSG